jgi:hypothetical protein
MAGYFRVYFIGETDGEDGINSLIGQILVGEGDRPWFEARYENKKYRPMGKVAAVIPISPEDPNMLLDSCLAFFPDLFKECPSLSKVSGKCDGLTRLDFDLEPNNIPKEWAQLRQEAEPVFKSLIIYQGELKKVKRPKRLIGLM